MFQIPFLDLSRLILYFTTFYRKSKCLQKFQLHPFTLTLNKSVEKFTVKFSTLIYSYYGTYFYNYPLDG